MISKKQDFSLKTRKKPQKLSFWGLKMGKKEEKRCLKRICQVGNFVLLFI